MTYWLNIDDTRVTKHTDDCEYVTKHVESCGYVTDHTLESGCKWKEFNTEWEADDAVLREIHECRICIVWVR